MPPPNPMRGILALMPVIANHLFIEGLPQGPATGYACPGERRLLMLFMLFAFHAESSS
jgi:hypothetical protein